MTYKLKDHVTNKMLVAVGFQNASVYPHRKVALTSRSYTYLEIMDRQITLKKAVGYGLYEVEIKSIPVSKKYIQDLIELGYVEEMK